MLQGQSDVTRNIILQCDIGAVVLTLSPIGAGLNDEFADLVHTGAIEQSAALPEETDHLDLPRLVFHHHRRGWARVRQLIDRINESGAAAENG